MITYLWQLSGTSKAILLVHILALSLSSSRGLNTSDAVCSSVGERSTLFVNSVLGEDSSGCGSELKPCKSVSYTVGQVISQNVSTVVLDISPGFYQEQRDLQLDCSGGNLRSITLLGARQEDQVVRFDFSIDIRLCSVCISSILWKGNRPLLVSVIMSDLSLHQCTIEKLNITLVGSSSNILIQNSTVKHCKSFRPLLPLISAASLPGYKSSLSIVQSRFLHNYGQLIFVADVHQVTIDSSLLQDNKAPPGGNVIFAQFTHLAISRSEFCRNNGSLLKIDGVGSANVSGSLFDGNTVLTGSTFLFGGKVAAVIKNSKFAATDSFLPGPVIKIQGNNASTILLDCHFSCNKVNSKFSSPVISDDSHLEVSCENCTVDPQCPVHCSPGEYISEDILCQPCPVGTFSPGTVRNKTLLQCLKCPAGYYSSAARSHSCIACDADTFSDEPGSTSCKKCGNDFFTSQPGKASCSSMTLGFIILSTCVAMFIFIPLLILLHRFVRCGGKKMFLPFDEASQQLCIHHYDERQYSLQSS